MIERKRQLCSLTLHFATQDLHDLGGKLVLEEGQVKPAQLEFSEWLEEDGQELEGTRRRVEADLSDAGHPVVQLIRDLVIKIKSQEKPTKEKSK